MKIFIILLILVAVLIPVLTIAFIGAGYLLSLIMPLSLFQSSILCIATTFVLAFIIICIVIIEYLYKTEPYYYEDDEDDEGGSEEEKFNSHSDSRFRVVNSKKVGRNEPCPCGSGKKYKYCCGRNA